MNFCPTVPVSIQCSFDVSFFPFDKSYCHIHFESIRYMKPYQILHTSPERLFSAEGNDQWYSILEQGIESDSEYSSGNFSALIFPLVIQRKPTYHVISVVIPLLATSLLEMATFALPVGCNDRLQLSFTCFLAFAFFSTIISNELPQSSDNAPVLLIFVNFYMATIAIIIVFQSLALYFTQVARKRQQNDKFEQNNGNEKNRFKISTFLFGNDSKVAAKRSNSIALGVFITVNCIGIFIAFGLVPILGSLM